MDERRQHESRRDPDSLRNHTRRRIDRANHSTLPFGIDLGSFPMDSRRLHYFGRCGNTVPADDRRPDAAGDLPVHSD